MLRKFSTFALLLLLLFTFPALSVLAQAATPPDFDEIPLYEVQRGETLADIAARYGLDAAVLARMNDLSDPRAIYVGQRLRLDAPAPGLDLRQWEAYTLSLGEDFSLAARRSGMAWEVVARVNRLLNPSAVWLGQSILLPKTETPLVVGVASPGETPLMLALRRDVSGALLQYLNPRPFYAGAEVLLPGVAGAPALPYPILSLTLTPQPIVRGQTAVFALETAAPAECQIMYLDRVEPCYHETETELYAFVSLSPMLEPTTYQIRLNVDSEGAVAALELPLVVTPGRFGYEQIIVSGPIAGLMDPALLESERQKLDAIALIRTPERYWQTPLRYPVQASVSSYFGSRRSYGGSYNSYHAGIDFRAGSGTPVRAVAAGRVLLAEPLAVRGNSIMVDHGWGLVSGYWHLSRIQVAPGQWVAEGQVIGLVGSTGLSTGSHLHWEMWMDGTPVNPLQWTEEIYPFPTPAVHTVVGAE